MRAFWEKHPLWTGESRFLPGTIEFFEEHRKVYINDCLAGSFDLRFLPPPRKSGQDSRILDLGCGVGFWVTELGMRGWGQLEAADLTSNALKITASRLEAYGVRAILSQQNAESLTYGEASFDHVNCQGVIHHTPDTKQAVAEIARILKPGGTASVSVYYRNWILGLWPLLRWLGWILTRLGGGMKGRGRERIFMEKDVSQIVRLYDGQENPLGKCYSRDEFLDLLQPHFHVEEVYFHFFPARALPFGLPGWLHRWLDAHCGFMMYASLQKA